MTQHAGPTVSQHAVEKTLAEAMDQAYGQLRTALFCEESGLIYDAISSHEPQFRFEHLPTIEEIAADLPNPHGYATGMEDCMLNAGFAIEMCLNLAAADPEMIEECGDFASRLVEGMLRCAAVHGHTGYVARGFSHRDRCSCYSESSRDQFTLFVYGLWRYFHSSFATAAEQAAICTQLCAVADFADSRMNPQHGYNLGRLDGFPGVNLQMIDVQPHEAMRLPMFCAAAYDVSGDYRYLVMYQQYAERGLSDSVAMHRHTRPWWHIELSQMQISLALCRTVDTTASHAEIFRELMCNVAKIAQEQTLERHLPRLSGYEGSWSPLAHAWRNAKCFSVQVFDDGRTAARGGKVYLKGEEDAAFKEAFDRIRAVGNMVTTMLLAPEFDFASGFWEKFRASATTPDHASHTSGALVNILCAYALARTKGHL